MSVRRYFGWVIAVCLAVTGGGTWGALNAPAEEAQPKAEGASPRSDETKPSNRRAKSVKDDEYYELFRAFADTMDQVERNYVKDVSRRELMEAAIKGVLSKLDPYSSYIGPEELGGFKSSVESQFGGIGIQITLDDGQLRVLSPLVGTPAYRAGIQSGDRIVKIEGESTRDLDLDEAVRRLKGEIGTSVTLTVRHSNNKEMTVTLKRETIHVSTVLGDTHKANDDWEFMLDPERGIGYIRITAFSRDTYSDLKKALDDLKSRNLRGLVLDLRFNPGGLLTSAIEIADLFVADGRIVSTKGRNTKERTWEARKDGTFEGFPMAVLVNRYSASASEIVSACLQDHKRAVVIGERTWGKGSVQNVIELEDGKSALKLTTASYQRPNGHNIHRFPDAKETDEWGVRPNDGYEVRLSEPEIGQFLLYRRSRDILAAKATSADANEGPSKPEDSQASSPSDSTGEKPPADDAASPEKSPEGATKTPQPAEEPKDDPPKNPEEKPSTEGPANGKANGSSGSKVSPPFVDRQLQKAVEYLTSELARAP